VSKLEGPTNESLFLCVPSDLNGLFGCPLGLFFSFPPLLAFKRIVSYSWPVFFLLLHYVWLLLLLTEGMSV